MITFTDTHAHLDLDVFRGGLDSVLARAREKGVEHILCPGIDLESTRRCIELADRYPGRISAAAGLHPNGCADEVDAFDGRLQALASQAQVTAIGETGLDNHHRSGRRDVQEDVFRRHIELAAELNKPLIIHGRKADEEILHILDEYASASGIRHCFDSSAQIANEYVDRGFSIAFGGLITREGHKKLKRAAAAVPDSSLVLETDSPYMRPPHVRGSCNEPAHITVVAAALAEIRGQPLKQIAEITTRNAARMGLGSRI